MRESTISKHCGPARRLSADLHPEVRQAVGRELRRRRKALGLSQAALGDPLTKAYVSAVESGRAVPSLPALRLMADRLGVPLSTFFHEVEDRLSNGS